MNDRNAIKAGLFILVTIALIVGVVIMISGFDQLVEPRQHFSADFKLADDLGGLKVGDDIRIGGAKVGEVKSIQIDPDNDRIRIGFDMPKKYTLHNDAILRVQGTVTGSSWLNFQTLGKNEVLADGQSLDGSPSQMSQLLASLGDSAPEIHQVLQTVRTQTLPRVNNTLDSFRTTGQNATHLIQHVETKIDPITDNATKAASDIHEMLGPSTGDFHKSMANVAAITTTLREKIPGLLDRVQITIANLKDISSSARSLLADNRSKLDAMIESLKITSDNLKNASADIWRSPWRLLYKPTPDEIGNLNLYDSTREFAEGASKLSEAAGALRDASHDPAVDKAHMQQLLDELNKAFARFHEVEQKLWTQVK